MSESLLGVSVTATRQNAGRSLNAFPPPAPRRPPSGATNFPGATTSARVTVASFKADAARLSHVAANADLTDAAIRNTASRARHFDVMDFISGLQSSATLDQRVA